MVVYLLTDTSGFHTSVDVVQYRVVRSPKTPIDPICKIYKVTPSENKLSEASVLVDTRLLHNFS